MASLRDLTINQSTSMDQITFDPRTRQYHDIANRYRMVRQSVVESLQRTNRVERNDSERYVAHTVFDAFRRDVYRHISDTANLTKKAVESLRTSLQNQIDDNRRLQQDINDTRENRQEQIQDRLSEESKRYESSPRRERGNRSFLSSFLGISGLGFGLFAALSYFMTSEQITRFGERVDETLSFIPDIQSTINAVNEINETMRRMLAFFGITAPQGGAESIGGAAAPAASTETVGDRMRAAAEPNEGGATPAIPETVGDRMQRAAVPVEGSAAETLDRLRRERGSARSEGEPIESEVERSNNPPEEPEEAAERIERTPERPEDVISQNLFNEEERQSIQNIRNTVSADDARRQIVSRIERRLRGISDRSQLANTIAAQIGQYANLHGAAEATRRIIEHGDPMRSAEMLYDTFCVREVSGRGRGVVESIATRERHLRERIQRVNVELNSRTEALGPENRSTAVTAITAAAAAANGTRITTAMLPGVTLPGAPGAPLPVRTPPAGVPGSIQARNSEISNGTLARMIQAGGGTVSV
jgi:hypothetical protein